ncbi:DUF6262 family protein [Trichocoleus sp. FACHB-262]|uniref:DUF6262 family protein n=1 Tax=Trichocoleus sp. FACHB-262 TaxID=2692869 RepID=UPI001684A1CC|nr:DUF6262 family protein [Trichocoleus sp. FACHB-262]MBD2123417.1 hypothetical protein [Trichocoleus sp. FACHB-262]
MKHERNVEGLKRNAQKKKQATLERAEQAIKQLLKENKPINFQSIANAAHVSTAWLYDNAEIRERIEHLREQQASKPPTRKQSTSSASKDGIITALKRRIGKLEVENQKLREQHEVAYGLFERHEELEQEVKKLRSRLNDLGKDNEALREQVQKLSRNASLKNAL